jgi:hypothetical protein
MDVYVFTVTGEPARSRIDAHADGSTFVPREATMSRFATNPSAQFHFMTDKFHFMTDKFHKVKSAYYWNQ